VLDMVTKEGALIAPDNTFGTTGQPNAPDFTMVPIAFKSGFRKRIGQGRMLFPVRASGFVSGNVLSAQAIGFFNTFITAVRDAYGPATIANEFRLITAHPLLPASRPHKSGAALPEIPAEWYDVETIGLVRTLSSLRSRKVGVGS
jgi:hypothetical protein